MLRIDLPNQVWCADHLQSRCNGGFQYLALALDWSTRTVLSMAPVEHTVLSDSVISVRKAWRRLSASYVQAGDLQHRPGQPIHRQSSHRSLTEGSSRPARAGGCDNIFIERLWRECVYARSQSPTIHVDRLTRTQVRLKRPQWRLTERGWRMLLRASNLMEIHRFILHSPYET